jgi:hypothetical protein
MASDSMRTAPSGRMRVGMACVRMNYYVVRVDFAVLLVFLLPFGEMDEFVLRRDFLQVQGDADPPGCRASEICVKYVFWLSFHTKIL